MVTAATYHNLPLLRTPGRLTLVRDALFGLAEQSGWTLQAWAVLPNHYHFVALSPEEAGTLRALVRRLHGATARAVNAEDGAAGRRVWFQYWESLITFERSYLARLRYVHENPVKHGLVANPKRYPWCSAAWFARSAGAAFYRTVMSFPTDALSLVDVECDADMECGDSSPL